MHTHNLQRVVLAALVAAGFGCGGATDDEGGSAAAGSGADTSALVGKACEPTSVPAEGFDPQEAYVEAHHAACGAGVCLAYRVAGDPRAACRTHCSGSGGEHACGGTAHCTAPADVEKHVACSCRCDGPDPHAHYCACRDGFVCAPVLEQGDPSLVGSYCTRP